MAMKLSLIMDTHVAKQVAIQLRNAGVDVLRLEEVISLANSATDLEILQWASENERAVLSLDDDFEVLHYAQGKNHNGIFFGRSHLQGVGGIGVIVKFILKYADIVDDMCLLINDLIEIKETS